MNMSARKALAIPVLFLLGGCRPPVPAGPSPAESSSSVLPDEPVSRNRAPERRPAAAPADSDTAPVCDEGDPLTVRFYDAGQALAALVTLPDGRHIMVDAGESPSRAACGAPCKAWHERVRAGLERDLGQDTVEMMWITHQHSDHLGGVPQLAGIARPTHYVDNGTSVATPGVKLARAAATAVGANLHVVDPSSPTVPMEGDARVEITPLLPSKWPVNCETKPNDCSIGLRIDYCRSSVLFVGDAEAGLEAAWTAEDVDLLQVGHHGSNTSSTQGFIDRVRPDYAVVSSADRGEGTNKTYCHPHITTVDRLTGALGGAGALTVEAFDESFKCRGAGTAQWKATPASDRLWFTSRDGDVILVTTGDGTFSRQP
jgi:competence protein ComEC